jgi:hypothetical protein
MDEQSRSAAQESKKMSNKFGRALDAVFIEKLEAEVAKAGWWADVLADPKLFIALRGSYLNVYWRGQSLFHVEPEPTSSGLKVTTHEKYLLDPALKSQVPLKIDGSFDVTSLVKNGFIDRYDGPATLEKMKKAAGVFSGREKTGCHEIAVGNHGVIDCEIAFPDRVTLRNGKTVNAPRVDLASLEPVGDDARLVFWEAKHFSNNELRAAGKQAAPVCYQVEGYQDYLSANRDEVERSYKKVAENLVAIRRMGWKRPLSTLIEEVGTRKRQLTLGDLGEKPQVGLIIFGFDMGQRDHPIWKDHLKGLKANIPRIRAAGAAKVIRV